MWWVLILKKIRIMPFFFFGGGGRGCGEGGGGSSPSQNIFNPFTP